MEEYLAFNLKPQPVSTFSDASVYVSELSDGTQLSSSSMAKRNITCHIGDANLDFFNRTCVNLLFWYTKSGTDYIQRMSDLLLRYHS